MSASNPPVTAAASSSSAPSSAASPKNAAYVACGALLLAVWPAAAPGGHMLLHVLMMSVAAPIAVAAMHWRRRRTWHTRPRLLWLATLLQLAIFFYWHSPSGMMFAMHVAGGELLLQGSLLAAAFLFWWCIDGLGPDRVWHAIAALLCTGKLFCLVAVILTFAPRPLYHVMSLPDQQLAGLIMITLCPMTYVASALWLCWRHVLGLGMRTTAAHGSASCS